MIEKLEEERAGLINKLIALQRLKEEGIETASAQHTVWENIKDKTEEILDARAERREDDRKTDLDAT